MDNNPVSPESKSQPEIAPAPSPVPSNGDKERPPEAKFKWPDGVALVSLIITIATPDMPLPFRIGCFILCAIFLPLSFWSHKNWPHWCRWILSIVAVSLMAYISYWTIKKANEPKEHIPTQDENANATIEKLKHDAPNLFKPPTPSSVTPLSPSELQEAKEKMKGEGGIPDNATTGIVASIRSSRLTLGDGNCGLFMSGYSAPGNPGAAYATPIVLLGWVRLTSKLGYGVLVDNYSLEVSDSPHGPWIPTRYVSVGEMWYTMDNKVSDNNTIAIRKAFNAIQLGTKLLQEQGAVYNLTTNNDNDCLRKAGLVRFPSLNEALKDGLSSHGVAEGWVGFNPPQSERLSFQTGKRVYYKMTIHTVDGNFLDYGELHSLFGQIGASPNTSEVGMVKVTNTFTDLRNYILRYLGP